MNKKTGLFFAFLVLFFIFTFLLSLAMGAHSIDLISLLQGKSSEIDFHIITELRLPRTILAFLVGAALAVSGAIVQTLFRNPLADPSLIGVSSGGALAAASTLVLVGTVVNNIFLLPVAAFLGSLLACGIIMKLSKTHAATSLSIVLLTGIAINALAGSGIGLLSYIASDTMLRSITFWTLGSLAQANWLSVLIAIIFIGILLIVIPFYSREFNALLLGETAAKHLGIAVEKLKHRALLATALVVGAAVALTGIIGFVGLVIPHIVRLIMGSNHQYVFPGSILLGGNLLMLADIGARTWLAPAELPIGIITALLGAPFFLILIMREKKL